MEWSRLPASLRFQRKRIYCLHQPLCVLHSSPPSSSKIYTAYWNTVKPAIVQSYRGHTGYADKSDGIINRYSNSRHTQNSWKFIFPPSGYLSTEQFILIPLFLWFRLSLVKVLIPETAGCRRHMLFYGETNTSDQPTDLTRHTTHWILTRAKEESKSSAACVRWKTRKYRQNSSVQNEMWGLAHKIAFFRLVVP